MMKRYTNKRISVNLNGKWTTVDLIASWETRSGIMMQLGEPFNVVITYGIDIASETNGCMVDFDSNLADERE